MENIGICKYSINHACTCPEMLRETNGYLACAGIFDGLDTSDMCPCHDDSED